MAIDPYIPISSADTPKLEERIPAPRGWRATRPGEVGPAGQPKGFLFGKPGPDAGYALTLGKRFRDLVELAPDEAWHDALACAAGLAMRRAADAGRAPVREDLELAFTVLGYLGGAPPELVGWRRQRVEGADHQDTLVRQLTDDVPIETLRLEPAAALRRLDCWRLSLGAPTNGSGGR
ncbi:MAG: hypothetical protein ACRDV9_09345 [Acidimicrobiia bacterium]